MSARLWSLALALLLSVAASAQQFDRRARDEPEVVVEAGGRVGTADAVRFTPDGQFLLVGGDDRVVRLWPHTAKGLDTDPARTKVLRWRGWRDQHGGIKCLAPSRDGKRVAVGGYGLKISSVAVLDRETGRTLAITWPRSREGGYRDAVTAVAFHPNGQSVAFGTADGSLWFWEPKKLDKPEGDRTWNAPVCAGRHANPEPDQLNPPFAIRFPDATTLVSVCQRGQVMACDLKTKLTDDPEAPAPAGKAIFDVNHGVKPKYPIHAAEWTGDGDWLVLATKGPLVLLRSMDGAKTVRLELPADHFPRSIAVRAKTNAVAVGVGAALPGANPRFYMEPDDHILVYADPFAANPEPAKLKHAGRAEAIAVHPTAGHLAVAGGDADEVILLDLAAPEKPLTAVRGAGRRLYGLNLSESGDVIALKTGRNPVATDPNDRATGEWARFDLARFRPTADANIKMRGPVSTADGWEIVPDATDRFVWRARRGEVSLKLLLDRDQDQAPTCYTFVPTPAGQPPRVLVGHYYGCSLFELDPANLAKDPETGRFLGLPRSKLFVGHGAEVNAIVAAAKGNWFVTAGADQTVAGWSLDDWKAEPALGATFVAGNNLVVEKVDVGSPAWEAGLSPGDRIELLAVNAEPVYDIRPNKKVGTPAVAAAALARPQSGVELFFGWTTAAGDRRATPTRIKQRPLWKWFPAFDDRGRITDSVIWMWHGSYYFTASAHADRMVGWHVNSAEYTGTPEFHSLERYKNIFLRPDVMSKLLATRSVEAALKEGAGDNSLKRSFREFEAPPIDLALKTLTVKPEGVTLTVSVNPAGNNPDLLPDRVELWVNDYRYRVWAGKGKQAIREQLTIPAEAFRAGDNQITLLALNRLRGRAEASETIHNPEKPEPPNLWGFAAGVDDYAGHRNAVAGVRAFGDLKTAQADAEALSREFLAFRGPGRHFPAGMLPSLLNSDAARDGITTSFGLMKAKQTRVRPDDLMVVFFAGHGDLLGADGKPVPPPAAGVLAARGLPADAGSFVFCCPNYTPARPGATAVSGEELFDALANVNCRKLVLLDTCHAGGAAEANALRRFIPNGQGPVVIAACDQSELSFEDEKLGHGVFTYAVMEALGSKFRVTDANIDGVLTPAELYDYVAARVPVLVREIRPGNTQNPICFPHPSALPKVAIVRQ